MTEAPKLLDRVRAALRVRHYSPRTEESYVGWIRRFILYHGKRHPSSMGAVLVEPLPWMDELVRAPRRERVPVVMTAEEVQAILGLLHGTTKLIAMLLYGSGLRLLEALRLRVKDVDFGRRQIFVRDAKANRDRVTMLVRRRCA